jgi:hypothetical protein
MIVRHSRDHKAFLALVEASPDFDDEFKVNLWDAIEKSTARPAETG